MTTFATVWLVVAGLGFAVCGSLCIFRTSMLVAWGRKNAKNKIRMVPIFKHTLQASVPHLHTLRGNLHLALGNRHLRSRFASFPLACDAGARYRTRAHSAFAKRNTSLTSGGRPSGAIANLLCPACWLRRDANQR